MEDTDAPTMASSKEPQRLASTVAAMTTQPEAEPEFMNLALKKCSIDNDVPLVRGWVGRWAGGQVRGWVVVVACRSVSWRVMWHGMACGMARHGAAATCCNNATRTEEYMKGAQQGSEGEVVKALEGHDLVDDQARVELLLLALRHCANLLARVRYGAATVLRCFGGARPRSSARERRGESRGGALSHTLATLTAAASQPVDPRAVVSEATVTGRRPGRLVTSPEARLATEWRRRPRVQGSTSIGGRSVCSDPARAGRGSARWAAATCAHRSRASTE